MNEFVEGQPEDKTQEGSRPSSDVAADCDDSGGGENAVRGVDCDCEAGYGGFAACSRNKNIKSRGW